LVMVGITWFTWFASRLNPSKQYSELMHVEFEARCPASAVTTMLLYLRIWGDAFEVDTADLKAMITCRRKDLVGTIHPDQKPGPGR
jgi:hypothetical protein